MEIFVVEVSLQMEVLLTVERFYYYYYYFLLLFIIKNWN